MVKCKENTTNTSIFKQTMKFIKKETSQINAEEYFYDDEPSNNNNNNLYLTDHNWIGLSINYDI